LLEILRNVFHILRLSKFDREKYLPATSQRCRSETENFIFEDLFSSVLSQFKKYRLSGNLKIDNFGVFRSFISYFNGKNPSNFS